MSKNTTVNIHGGIGNQLYQYAFLVGLKESCNKRISLVFFYGDMKFPREPLNLYNLLKLDVADLTPNANLVSRFYNKLRRKNLQYLFYFLNERFGNAITEQQEFGFRKILLKRNLDGVILEGYFADYRYLKEGLDQVKVAFEKLTKTIDILYDRFVAVHIRRGDYTKIMRSDNKTNVLDINYYRRCLEKINNKDWVLRIYTDDYEWAKSEFPLLFDGYRFDFSPEEYSDVDSLWTMSRHQYLIGANSTFSLWAYYFGMHDIQKAMFPAEWVTSIHKKGFELYSPAIYNVQLIDEE